MTSTSLNIAGKIDPRTVATIAAVAQAITEVGMPYVIVGATARDLVLHHGHGANLQRATQDVDFAIEVPDWSAFEAVKERLCAQGFQATKASHRLVDSAGGIIDIVPFGHIQDEQVTIAWPPTGEIEMNVLGFKEACNHAQWVRLQEDPALVPCRASQQHLRGTLPMGGRREYRPRREPERVNGGKAQQGRGTLAIAGSPGTMGLRAQKSRLQRTGVFV